MNREILFRGKCMLDGRLTWTYGDLLHTYGKIYIHPKANMFRVDGNLSKLMVTHEVLPETVGQYTGLTDKNGKKIFEGDVVIAYFRNNGSRQKFNVCFDDGMFLFDNKCVKVPSYDIFSIEVIGNIHDNPELIGGGRE